MGLNFATIQQVLFWLKHEWDCIFTFNKLLHEMNNFWVSLVIGHENISHVTCHDVL